MAVMRKLEIELPQHLADDIDRRVASGGYAGPSDVIVHALETVADHDHEVEHWLRTQVGPTLERRDRDKTAGVPLDEAVELLKARRQARHPG